MTTKEIQISEAFIDEQKKLTGFVRKKVKTNEDAEDIVQEVFMSLTDGFDDILNLSGLIGWIYSVAKNKIIDFNRKKKTSLIDDRKTKQTDEGDELSLADILPSFESLPDDQMMQDLVWEQIKQSLELLPANQRDVFIWHELEGSSFKQIADFTGETVNTLISRKRYAILFLRDELKELFEIIKS